jgi:hypothetical protein
MHLRFRPGPAAIQKKSNRGFKTTRECAICRPAMSHPLKLGLCYGKILDVSEDASDFNPGDNHGC